MRAAGEHVGVRREKVAVLFADLSGFTRLVESVDPERVYEVVRPLMDELVAVVHEHDGSIQQVLGDGFMSVFGLHAHRGDEAVRAVRAGMSLVWAAERRCGQLPVHVGIECGEVLVSPSWEPAGFAVWGRAVTLAKRLCDLAGPGTVHIGPQAYELAGHEVECSRPVHVYLKGIARRIPVRSVMTASARTSSAVVSSAVTSPALPRQTGINPGPTTPQRELALVT